MPIRRRHNGNGSGAPAGNGDPFQRFVMRELEALGQALDGLAREFRDFREEQARNWRIQNHYWKVQDKKWEEQRADNRETLAALRKINARLDRQDEINRRQDRANRVLFRQIQRLRTDR